MRYMAERQQITNFGKKLVTEKLTTGTGGNISIYIRKDNVMLISPSGIPYDDIKPEDIVLLDLDGNTLEGTRKPSSEYQMHCIFYKKTENVNSVVHTHSDYATAISCLNQDIEPLHYIIGSIGDKVRCCEYRTYGTQELADEAYRVMGKNNGILLGNHGVLAVGSSCAEAFSVAKDIEFLAKLKIRAQSIGTPKLLNERQMEVVIKKFDTYGQIFDEV
ncbi:L-fuculose-phosphate aldolase [Enterococcus sp. DIV0086]|uniref:L-fuculose-phosphate aldolase n=1 Tax=Enterococcus sp. DIV0086 TaxID=2774655 RepID=UPI003D267D68